MTEAWSGRIHIENFVSDVDVVEILPDHSKGILGQWFGSGTLVTGDLTTLFESPLSYETDIGKLIITNIDLDLNKFEFQGIGTSRTKIPEQ